MTWVLKLKSTNIEKFLKSILWYERELKNNDKDFKKIKNNNQISSVLGNKKKTKIPEEGWDEKT